MGRRALGRLGGGDDPPFHHPVFVVTHHAREPLAVTHLTYRVAR